MRASFERGRFALLLILLGVLGPERAIVVSYFPNSGPDAQSMFTGASSRFQPCFVVALARSSLGCVLRGRGKATPGVPSVVSYGAEGRPGDKPTTEIVGLFMFAV